ncbi:hypothetical protein CGRA01v4_13092 [Colletotrichum graminicola]|nr:hypothetical protein CGRA01v4_13092 [Colletotrichum graminicola]
MKSLLTNTQRTPHRSDAPQRLVNNTVTIALPHPHTTRLWLITPTKLDTKQQDD